MALMAGTSPAMTLNSKLPEFLDQAARREWWRDHDCGLWLADWYVFATGEPDPAAHLRGTYHDMASCQARHGRHPALRMIKSVVRELGLPVTHDPMLGDIAIIAVRHGPAREAIGAIRGRDGWIVPHGEPRGVTHLPNHAVKILAAWRIEEHAAGDCSRC